MSIGKTDEKADEMKKPEKRAMNFPGY